MNSGQLPDFQVLGRSGLETRALRDALSPGIEAIVLRAMSREREGRFHGAEAMREALLAAESRGASAMEVTDVDDRTVQAGSAGADASAPPSAAMLTPTAEGLSIRANPTRSRHVVLRLAGLVGLGGLAVIAVLFVFRRCGDPPPGETDGADRPWPRPKFRRRTMRSARDRRWGETVDEQMPPPVDAVEVQLPAEAGDVFDEAEPPEAGGADEGAASEAGREVAQEAADRV